MKIYTSRKERNTRKEGTGKRQDWVEEETGIKRGKRQVRGEETGVEGEETVVEGEETGGERDRRVGG